MVWISSERQPLMFAISPEEIAARAVPPRMSVDRRRAMAIAKARGKYETEHPGFGHTKNPSPN
jgi:hypothetical protein